MPIRDVSSESIEQLISLRGRRAVITGGARGIGLAIARRLAEAGADILLGDINAEGARDSAAELSDEFGVAAIGAATDVLDSETVVALADRGVAELGGIDIWVNNAGIFPQTPLLELDDELWDQVVDMSLRGSFFGSREAARRMIEQGGGGVIINMSSTAGLKGRRNMAHYSSAKHGILGLTKALAIELGPHGIRVLALAPTLTETPGALERRERGGSEVRELEENMGANLPLGRSAVPDDVARVALFCASDLSLLMTGCHVAVDAGDSAI